MIFQPKSVQDICQFVQENDNLYPQGGGTKRALIGSGQMVDMSALSGIIDYQPDEYVFTAYAGTSLKEINETLQNQGQFLPFDPLYINEGTTIGGTIAANTCGPGRFRYGGIRDYILRIGIVDGEGRAFNGGEKVVKNAAGFDLPKFFVGSRGKFGIITEASFKVFPMPPASLGIIVQFHNLQTAYEALLQLGRSSFDIHALDLFPTQNDRYQLFIRLSGLPQALQERGERLVAFLRECTNNQTDISFQLPENDLSKWKEAISINPASGKEWLFQVAISLEMLLKLEQKSVVFDCERRYSCGANLLFIYSDNPNPLKETLLAQMLPFLIIDGPGPIQQQLTASALPMYKKLKRIFDPKSRFGDL